MKSNRRYPISFTLLAGLAGAIAWGLPYPMAPFLSLIPFLPDFQIYASPPFQIPLARFTFSYALSGLIAVGLILFGMRFLPINREPRPSFTPKVILSVVVGFVVAGIVAIVVGLLLGSSPTGYALADNLGFSDSIEPFLSMGWVLGIALATILICSFSGLIKPSEPGDGLLFGFIVKTVLKFSGIALLIRLITCFIEISSFVTYTIGSSIFTFILFQVISGFIYGILSWKAFSRLQAA